jgi:LPS sulfotransferase NodH
MGDRDEAQARFEKCLELDPKNEFALARLADASVFSDRDQPLLGRLEQSATESKNPDIHYALGRAYDKLEDYDAAWREFTKANELDRATHPEYRQSHSEALVRRIIDRCDAEWLSKFGGTSHEAIFVCGMFRSGSTLLEQILAAHPGFAAGGESEFFPRLVMKNFRGYPDGIEVIDPVSIEVWREEHAALCAQLTEGDERMTDKRPDNFLYAGLIKAIVPGAKFVVTERDWRDVVVSVFCNRLGPGQAYATRPQDIKHYLGLHRELIDHWAGLLGEDVIRVSYEDLVESPTATIGTLLEQLGEEWDDACLEFDTREGSVGTASVWQVREPINPKSIGRWKNYEKYFEQEFGAAT